MTKIAVVAATMTTNGNPSPMIKCTECGGKRVASFTADIPNGCHIELSGKSYEGDEIPDDIGLGSGTTIEFEYCLECGILSGDFPLEETSIEAEEEAEGDD